MKVVPLTSISVPSNRMRKEFSQMALWDLEASIKKHGLFHPIVVRAAPEDRYVLVAGENRLRAVTAIAEEQTFFRYADLQISPGLIPVQLLSDLTELEAMEIELEENVRRTDLSWQDRTAAEARLHELRTSQNPNHTIADTAREIRGEAANPRTATTVSESIHLARFLDDPDVAKAKSKAEAIRVVEKKQEIEAKKAAAERVDLTTSSHVVLCGPAEQMLDHLPYSFDCIVTDPPYGIEASGFGEQAGTVVHNYLDSRDWYATHMPGICRSLFSAAASRAHLYMFFDMDWYESLRTWLEDAGWYVWRHPIIWYKPNSGMLPRPEHAPRRCYEPILFCTKGDKKVQRVAKDVIEMPLDESKIHGAQKPIALYEDLLSRSCFPGDRVLDPFAGSGTIFPAANRLKLLASGIELDEENYKLCLSRINEK